MDVAKIKSTLALNCPKCRKAKLFKRSGWFVYKQMLQMPEHCPHCGLKYEIEPGFWIGALWPSYPLVVIIELPFLMMALFSTLGNPWIALIMMAVAFLICWPLFLRLGRSIWIHAWVKYNPPA